MLSRTWLQSRAMCETENIEPCIQLWWGQESCYQAVCPAHNDSPNHTMQHHTEKSSLNATHRNKRNTHYRWLYSLIVKKVASLQQEDVTIETAPLYWLGQPAGQNVVQFWVRTAKLVQLPKYCQILVTCSSVNFQWTHLSRKMTLNNSYKTMPDKLVQSFSFFNYVWNKIICSNYV